MNQRVLRVASAALQLARGMKKYSFPVTFENVVFPPDGQMKLPAMPAEPYFDSEKGEFKNKHTKRMIEGRGVEEIHTDLIHRQYGIAAISGGFISSADFKFLQVGEEISRQTLSGNRPTCEGLYYEATDLL
ncbi:hypothetical protein L596_028637 [Steinernema carpocapsae]|uniref:Uncharacterized protein n=1 Tax=Steinernema carpocapsae TaxID=34508 RepID=A0A4U5LYZ4_STECR|nr:hypothetical protein L596_028637 [Steinernema carpocapsae]